jgi:hypothetical protein
MKRRAAGFAALVSAGLVVLGQAAVATARHSHRPSHSLPPRTAAQPPARLYPAGLPANPRGMHAGAGTDLGRMADRL